MLRKFIILVAIVAATSVVDSRSRMKRVVGGTYYPAGSYPFHVSLWYNGDNNIFTVNTPDKHHTCGGSLIDQQWVLASALCFDPNFLEGLDNLALWDVVLGMDKQTNALTDPNVQFAKIEAVFFGPTYNLSKSYGDIALLKLTAPVILAEGVVETVKYNNDPNFPALEQECQVIGWGQVSQAPYGFGSDEPHEGTVKINSTEECISAYIAHLNNLIIDDTLLCAGLGEGGVDGCYGDSGSPLVCDCSYEEDDDEEEEVGEEVDDDVVIENKCITGIMSYGFGCGQPGYLGVYTRISAYVDWIEETIDSN